MDQASTSAVSSSETPVDWSPDCKYMKFGKLIGRGGFKKVFQGMDNETGKLVAWCELLEGNQSERQNKKFRSEARKLRKLQHPNILEFCDFWQTDSQIVMITELMTPGNLKTHLQQVQEIRFGELKSWCLQILQGLSFLHSRTPPIVHRDLKCDNLFYDSTLNQVKIGDLGLAKAKKRPFFRSDVGTPGYKSPEVLMNFYDEAADIYAFGMCVLEIITRQYPYIECKTERINERVLMGIMPAGIADVSNKKVRALILACIRSSQENRPTCTQLMDFYMFSDRTDDEVVVSLHEEIAMEVESPFIHSQLESTPHSEPFEWE